MAGNAARIPPKGQLESSFEARRVRHGWDVVVRLRSIDLSEELEEHQAVMLAFLGIARWLEDTDVDVAELLRDGPEGQVQHG